MDIPLFGYIIVEDNGVDGNAFPITKDRVVIGRKSTCDVCIPATVVSKEHCIIRVLHGVALLTNVSVNTTIVDGDQLDHKEQRILLSESIITIGDRSLRFVRSNERAAHQSTPSRNGAIRRTLTNHSQAGLATRHHPYTRDSSRSAPITPTKSLTAGGSQNLTPQTTSVSRPRLRIDRVPRSAPTTPTAQRTRMPLSESRAQPGPNARLASVHDRIRMTPIIRATPATNSENSAQQQVNLRLANAQEQTPTVVPSKAVPMPLSKLAARRPSLVRTKPNHADRKRRIDRWEQFYSQLDDLPQRPAGPRDWQTAKAAAKVAVVFNEAPPDDLLANHGEGSSRIRMVDKKKKAFVKKDSDSVPQVADLASDRDDEEAAKTLTWMRKLGAGRASEKHPEPGDDVSATESHDLQPDHSSSHPHTSRSSEKRPALDDDDTPSTGNIAADSHTPSPPRPIRAVASRLKRTLSTGSHILNACVKGPNPSIALIPCTGSVSMPNGRPEDGDSSDEVPTEPEADTEEEDEPTPPASPTTGRVSRVYLGMKRPREVDVESQGPRKTVRFAPPLSPELYNTSDPPATPLRRGTPIRMAVGKSNLKCRNTRSARPATPHPVARGSRMVLLGSPTPSPTGSPTGTPSADSALPSSPGIAAKFDELLMPRLSRRQISNRYLSTIASLSGSSASSSASTIDMEKTLAARSGNDDSSTVDANEAAQEDKQVADDNAGTLSENSAASASDPACTEQPAAETSDPVALEEPEEAIPSDTPITIQSPVRRTTRSRRRISLRSGQRSRRNTMDSDTLTRSVRGTNDSPPTSPTPASPLGMSPLAASPLAGSPLTGSPLIGSPLAGSPRHVLRVSIGVSPSPLKRSSGDLFGSPTRKMRKLRKNRRVTVPSSPVEEEPEEDLEASIAAMAAALGEDVPLFFNQQTTKKEAPKEKEPETKEEHEEEVDDGVNPVPLSPSAIRQLDQPALGLADAMRLESTRRSDAPILTDSDGEDGGAMVETLLREQEELQARIGTTTTVDDSDADIAARSSPAPVRPYSTPVRGDETLVRIDIDTPAHERRRYRSLGLDLGRGQAQQLGDVDTEADLLAVANNSLGDILTRRDRLRRSQDRKRRLQTMASLAKRRLSWQEWLPSSPSQQPSQQQSQQQQSLSGRSANRGSAGGDSSTIPATRIPARPSRSSGSRLTTRSGSASRPQAPSSRPTTRSSSGTTRRAKRA